MFKKVKKICLNTKTLTIAVIALIVLAIIGFGLSVYLGAKVANLKKDFAEIGPREKLEKIHSYALVLEKFEELERKKGAGNTTGELERAVLTTGSGVLKSLFDEMIFGENLEKDMEYFLDAVIDALKFYSE